MTVSKKRNLLYFLLLGACLIIAFAPFFFFDDSQMHPLITENGLYQNLTAIAFLLAAVFLGLAFFLSGNGNDFGKLKTRHNVFVFLLALVFLIGAGEELSWGQHMIGFEPPEAIAKHNIQREFNIHNLVSFSRRNADGSPKTGLDLWLTIGRLFSLFWFGYCVCIPLIAAKWFSVKQFLLRINLPIVPLTIGMVFPLNYVFSKIVVVLTGASAGNVAEVTEANFGILFFVFSVGLYFNLKQTVKATGP